MMIFTKNQKNESFLSDTKYGKGGALICAIDLLDLQDKPEARQLYYSMLKYIDSDEFNPEEELSKELLDKILPHPQAR